MHACSLVADYALTYRVHVSSAPHRTAPHRTAPLRPVLLSQNPADMVPEAVRAAAKLGVDVHPSNFANLAASLERECAVLRERHGADSADAVMASMVRQHATHAPCT